MRNEKLGMRRVELEKGGINSQLSTFNFQLLHSHSRNRSFATSEYTFFVAQWQWCIQYRVSYFMAP